MTADAPGVSRVLLHDFNGNGLTDVAAAALTDSQLAMYAAAPNREFLPETVLDGSLLGASLLVGAHINSNQDNRLDLVYASPLLTTVKYVLHDGAASFEPGGIAWSTPVTVRTLPTGHRIQALAAANVDGDAGNTVDLVVAYAVPSSSSGGSRVMLLRGNGLGGFSDSTIANEATVQNVLHVLVADVAGDGDGHLDVVVAFGGTGAPASDCSDGVLWLVNDGADAFTALPIATCEFTLPTSLTVSDVDGDLDLDVLVAASAGLFIIPNRLDPLFCPNDFFPLGEAEVCTPCTTPCPALTYDDGTPCAYNTDKCSTCRCVVVFQCVAAPPARHMTAWCCCCVFLFRGVHVNLHTPQGSVCGRVVSSGVWLDVARHVLPVRGAELYGRVPSQPIPGRVCRQHVHATGQLPAVLHPRVLPILHVPRHGVHAAARPPVHPLCDGVPGGAVSVGVRRAGHGHVHRLLRVDWRDGCVPRGRVPGALRHGRRRVHSVPHAVFPGTRHGGGVRNSRQHAVRAAVCRRPHGYRHGGAAGRPVRDTVRLGR